MFAQSSFYENKVLSRNLPELTLGEVPCFHKMIVQHCFKKEWTLECLDFLIWISAGFKILTQLLNINSQLSDCLVISLYLLMHSLAIMQNIFRFNIRQLTQHSKIISLNLTCNFWILHSNWIMFQCMFKSDIIFCTFVTA